MSAQSMRPPAEGSSPNLHAHIVGRYALYGDFAAGGMATVHFGRLLGPVGFSRTVAIKRLHPQFARDDDFVSMFVDEARLAARVRHTNVVQTLDVVQTESELLLVMEYVHGESLDALLRKALIRGERIPPYLAVGIVHQALLGLHAAHEARNEQGEPLELVHRDMSPHNVLVGVDGVARVLDFGIAKAGGRAQVTRDGQIKGKLSYFPPEQLTHEHVVDRRADVYAAAATLWEALAGRKMILGENEFQRMQRICSGELPLPSQFAEVPEALEAIVMKGLARDPSQRFATAKAMALALEGVLAVASSRAIGEWVEAIGGEALGRRTDRIAAIERHSAELTAGAIDGLADGPISMTVGSASRSSAPPSSPSLRTSWPGRSLTPPSMDVEPAPRRRGAWLLLLLLLLAAGGATFFLFGDRVREALQLAPGPSTVAATAAATAAATHDPPPTPPSTGAAAGELPAATAAATEVSPVDAAPAWARPSPRHAGRPAAPAAAPTPAATPAPTRADPPAAAPAKADCDVPFTIDEQGIRHPKLECL